MSDIQIWGIAISWLLLIALSMLLKIRGIYKKYAKENSDNSKLLNLKLAIIEFSDVSGVNRYYASVVFIIVILPFIFIGAFFGAILPLIVLQFSVGVSGLVFSYYFIKTVIDTVKSIKKEKFKTTIKMNWKGIFSLFVFLLLVLAYSSKINYK
ncbi:MAG: hypothetical protein ACM3KR_08425 [Deltaproteobacteria bacterium]